VDADEHHNIIGGYLDISVGKHVKEHEMRMLNEIKVVSVLREEKRTIYIKMKREAIK